MAYTGWVTSPDFTRSDLNENITGDWTFDGNRYVANGQWAFTQEIQGTALYAKWGDLAEVYDCDADEVFVPGTLVKFG